MPASDSGRYVKCFGVIAVIPKRVQFSTAKEDKVIAGKPDFGKILSGTPPQGQYFPGSKEYRAWDEGNRYRHGGTAAARPSTDNPFNQTNQPAEYAAWDAGWSTAHAMQAGQRFMPATSGAAPA